MTTTTRFDPLGELYLEALSTDALHGGLASTISDGIWAALQGDAQANINDGLIDAAGKLVRDAMGILEITISRISDDQRDLPDETDWPRLNAFWDGPSSPDELRWVISELTIQSERCFDTHNTYADPRGSHHNGGIHWSWVADLQAAAQLFLAAENLLKEVVQ